MHSQVRQAQLADTAVLVDLMEEFYGEASYPLPRRNATQAFESLLADPRLGAVLIVNAGDAAIGYLVLTFGYSMEYGGLRAFVDDLYVRTSARGKGLGGALLRAARARCIDAGVRALLVETGLDGHLARRLYLREGFADSGRALLTQKLSAALHEDSSTTP